MSEIDELQRRITAALDRMGQGLEKLGAGQSEGANSEMAQALEEERTANAQLSERVRVLKSTSEDEAAALRARLEETGEKMAHLDTVLQKLRRANAQLTEACAALRDANAEGVGDAHLINKSMMSELEALRAARAADAAEASTIMAALTPLLENASTEGSL